MVGSWYASASLSSTARHDGSYGLLDQAGNEQFFREARAAQMPLAEVSLHFGSLRITARELRGGAIIFLFPQAAQSAAPTLLPP